MARTAQFHYNLLANTRYNERERQEIERSLLVAEIDVLKGEDKGRDRGKWPDGTRWTRSQQPLTSTDYYHRKNRRLKARIAELSRELAQAYDEIARLRNAFGDRREISATGNGMINSNNSNSLAALASMASRVLGPRVRRDSGSTVSESDNT